MMLAKSLQSAAGNAAGEANYIEDVFSTWLYTGNDSTQTITNGIDLAGEGGMVWMKSRTDVASNALYDTVRGATKEIESNSTGAEATRATGLTAFNSNGFSIGARATINSISQNYASWTFRKQPKFFDVVTYTGNDATQNIAHNLGSVPGCMIVKRTDSTGDWWVYHRSLTNAQYLRLNLTNAVGSSAGLWDSTTPTSTQFTLGASTANTSGATYVAYLFAHDSGGFGLTGEDNVISCGSFSIGSSGAGVINLDFEPQFIIAKRASGGSADWNMADIMRGMPVSSTGSATLNLMPNTSGAETNAGLIYRTGMNRIDYDDGIAATGTGIYIAIRRGPMKVPESGTSVFSPNTQTGAGTSAGQTITTNFPVDLVISSGRSDNSGGNAFVDRLRGGQNYIQATNTNAEVNFTSWTPLIGFANNTGITDANYGSTSASYVDWNFRRAPGFFDEVCYTGTGSARTVTHNLAAVPELMIIKARIAGGYDWMVYQKDLGNTSLLKLNETGTGTNRAAFLNSTTPTASVFTVGTDDLTNVSGGTFVAYLFASCPGVSKVFSFTGNGSSQTINCGFTGGARFVMIKRTDSTGDWYVWDSARGIVSGNDPHLSLNTTAAEVTTDDSVDTDSTGFIVNQLSATNINVSSATYIGIAIA